ncbi:type II secretion system F family protein, partial [Xanthomonas perforans]|nr:type II secretion system F family protein [Xanthomonas perforans]
MSAVRSTIKSKPAAISADQQMSPFVWEGTDKRGVKMKGEQIARNANM